MAKVEEFVEYINRRAIGGGCLMEEIRKEIEHKLLEIEQKEQVRILHAVESRQPGLGIRFP